MALVDTPARLARGPAVALTGAALALGLLDRGGFGVTAGVTMLLLLAAAAAAQRGATLRPRHLALVGATGLLLAWWLLSSVVDGVPSLALPFALSLGCFALAVVVGARAGLTASRAGEAVVTATTWYAAVGLVGVAFRIDPLVLRAQGIYRLSGTLTYANASGALLALGLVVALAGRADDRVRRVSVLLLTAALAETLCRSALLAVLLAVPLVGWRKVLEHRAPLLLGSAAAMAHLAVATSPAPQPWTLAVLAGAVVLVGQERRWVPSVALGAGLVLVVLHGGLLGILQRRLGSGHVDDRLPEWGAAWRQFLAHPVRGAGAERHLFLPSGELARFVHDEPLQVLASAGLVGLALLVVLVAQLLRSVRLLALPARAPFVVIGVCALFDFVLHLPVLTTTLGLLATTLEEEPVRCA